MAHDDTEYYLLSKEHVSVAEFARPGSAES